MDILRIIESYNIHYNKYQHSPIKCILYGRLSRLEWLYKNKYLMTLYDKDLCYCDKPYWMYVQNTDVSLRTDLCGHCQVASTTKLSTFSKEQNLEQGQKTEITLWLEKNNL